MYHPRVSARVGVFHLVRGANGIEPFTRFVTSLRAALPTGDWTLVLIFKGFSHAAATAPYLDQVRDLPVQTVSISDEGFDISSYYRATEATQFPVLAFFNSFSEIVEPRWFSLMHGYLEQPGVGLVGATGSLESVVRNHVIYGREAERWSDKALKYGLAAGLLAMFPGFPNAHLRTNAFMIRRPHFLAARAFPVQHRLAALVYESGWLSLTRRIQRMGLQVLVVDRLGRGLPPEHWADSHCFRSGDQENVLVRDNRILEFERATPERRQLLQRLTWGDGYRRRS